MNVPVGGACGGGSAQVGDRPGGSSGPPGGGRVLKLSGVGFKCFASPGGLTFGLGYSHYLGCSVPVGMVSRPGRGHLAVGPGRGDLLGRVIRLRTPDPYKARGIYVAGEIPHRKEGKRR